MKKIILEEENFKINDFQGKNKWYYGRDYKIDHKRGILEFTSGPYMGQQLFTHKAALIETAKVGKILPTYEEIKNLSKDDILNPIYCGEANTDCQYMSNYGFSSTFWTSTADVDNKSAYRFWVVTDNTKFFWCDTNANDFHSIRCKKQ